MMRNFLAGLAACVWAFWSLANCGAADVTLVYSGQTHAMIYHCNCPYEPDGGVARRAALIRQLRNENPAMLLVDSGGYTAGGLMDENTQNADLDIRRSIVNIKAMDLMRYDAVGVGDDEFNFGRKFWEDTLSKTKLPLVSANINSPFVKPWIIKEAAGVKFGITSVGPLFVSQKADGIRVTEPRKALEEAVAQLKSKGAQVIILLGYLGESEDTKLIREVPGVDILIIGRNVANQDNMLKVNQTLILKPSWQGRRLDKLSLSIDNGTIKQYKLDQLRLSDQIQPDPAVLTFLPQCFTNGNCKKESAVGICQNPGLDNASCAYTEAPRVNLTVITDKSCVVCQTEPFLKYLKIQFPGLAASYLYYPDTEAKSLIKKFGIESLPAYILDRQVEKEPAFEGIKKSLIPKEGLYLIKPEFTGMAYLINRPRIKGRLDLFISLYNKDVPALLGAVKEYNPVIHFLATEKTGGFQAEHGEFETEEFVRSVCVQKYYPQAFWPYVTCRAADMNTSWWEDCLGALAPDRIRTCARSDEGAALLRDNIALNKSLSVMFGPTFLVDNRLIFGTNGIPSKEEMKKILNNDMQ